MLLPTFSTWSAFYADASNSYDLATVPNWETILPGDTADAPSIDILLEESDMMIMAIAPVTQDVLFFHHFTKLGGSRVQITPPSFVALHGLDDSASSIIIDATSMTKKVSIKVPKISDISAMDDVDSILLKATNQPNLTTKPVMLLPPPFADSVFKLTSHKPEFVLLHFLNHITKTYEKFKVIDMIADPDDPDESVIDNLTEQIDTFSNIFRWLWAASHKKIPCIVTSPTSANINILRWSAQLHSLHIKSNSVVPITSNTEISALRDLSSSMNALTAVAHGNLTQPQNSTPTPTKNTFDKFPAPIQQMFLFASSADGSTTPTTPNQRLKDLLACKNSTGAKQFLSHVITSEFKCMAVIPQSLAMAAYQGCLLWDNRSIPTNFSIFFCGEPTAFGTDSNSKTLLYNLKISEGKGLTETDFKDAIKCDYFFPSNVHELKIQVQNFAGLLGVLFGETSYLVEQMLVWDEHIQSFLMAYKMASETNKNLFTQVLYCIDMSVQNFLRSCKDATSREAVHDSFLDFSRDQKDIVSGRFYLRTPSLKDPEIVEPPNKKLRGNRERRVNEDPNQIVHNSNGIPECTLRTGEDFGRLFIRGTTPQPKQNNKPICLNFHIRGSCRRTCRRSHDTLLPDSRRAFIEYCKKCREAPN